MGDKKIITAPLQGFMELLPNEQIAFDRIKNTIEEIYVRYGFLKIDTPIIERSEVLLAKAGGETEKQIYRFNKGDNDLSLRFDLTVPLARYVAEYNKVLEFPFRRYAIGKVFRGERPQRGRFREFYQADIDIINKDNLNILNDVEIISIIYDIFKTLDFTKFTIRINNRKILKGFLEYLGLEKKIKDILILIDKIDKIGNKEFTYELEKICNDREKIDKILEIINIKGNNEQKISSLRKMNIDNNEFIEGINEIEKILEYSKAFNIDEEYISFDLSIVRGLDYYTGTIYETIFDDYTNIGSVCSGGRYDNLTSLYTKESFPGVGVSIGLTRLFDQLKENGLLDKKKIVKDVRVLIVNMRGDFKYALNIAKKLREENINTEVYFEDGKLGKKLEYANKRNIPFVIIIGEDEIKNGLITLRDMNNKKQNTVDIKEAIEIIHS
ncbi:MAG TPA: histidine--tRNA ligase [bacterium]|nr:histidine--tRNA ligase [bacterium]